MAGFLIAGSIAVFSFGWMLWHARRGARKDCICPKAMSNTHFPGGNGGR